MRGLGVGLAVGELGDLARDGTTRPRTAGLDVEEVVARAAVGMAQLLLPPAGLERRLGDHELGRDAGAAAGFLRMRPHLGDEVLRGFRHRAAGVTRAAHRGVEPGLQRGALVHRQRGELACGRGGTQRRHARLGRQGGLSCGGKAFRGMREHGRNCRAATHVGKVEAVLAGLACRLGRGRGLAAELAVEHLGQPGAARLRHLERHLLVEHALPAARLLAVHHAVLAGGRAHRLHDHLQEEPLELLGRRAQGGVRAALAARQALEVTERVGVERVELEALVHGRLLR